MYIPDLEHHFTLRSATVANSYIQSSIVISKNTFNTYSMKQPDLYYFEAIKITSQALSNFVWRIRTAGEYSL